jgi:hypothetical protein
MPGLVMIDALPLPHQLFLLSHRPGKDRLDDDSEPVRGSLLSAAAVAELCIAGLLRDRDGRAGRTNAATPVSLDPFLAKVLGDVPPDRPRRWFEVLERRWGSAESDVRDHLAAAGFVTVEHRQVLGPFRTKRISVAEPGQVQALRDRIRDVAGTGSGAAVVPIGDAVLVTLAVDGLVGTVFRWRELRTHRATIGALADRVDREMPGLRKALSYSIAARRGS